MKRILQILGGLVLFILITFFAIALSFDPNYYKPQIEKLIKDATGRQLKISGKIGWALWPNFGVTLTNVSLANAPDFPEEPMVNAELLAVDVAVWPLFSKKVEVGNVRFDGVTLRYQTRNGVTNFDDLGKPVAVPVAAEPAKPLKVTLPPVSYHMQGLTVNQLVVEVRDLAADALQTLTVDSLTVADLAPGNSSPFSLNARFEQSEQQLVLAAQGQLKVAEGLQQASLAPVTIKVTTSGGATPLQFSSESNIDLDLAAKKVVISDLTAVVNGIALNAEAELQLAEVPVIRAKLDLPTLDLNPFMGESETASGGDETAPAAAQELDLSPLHLVDAKVGVTIGQLLVRQAKVEDIDLTVAVKDGVLNVAPFTANLYDGTFGGSLMVQDKGVGQAAAYQVYSALRGVSIGPLLVALNGDDPVTGKATMEFRGNGKGLAADSWRSTMNGRGNFEVRDGAVKGFNVAQEIRNTRAMLRGGEVEDAPKQTDFAALTGSLNLANGKAENPDLLLMSPLLRIDGRGTAQLVEESLDYRLGVSVVGTLKGQDGKSRDELNGVTIPLLISGPWAAPNITLDVTTALQNKAVQEVKGKAEAEIDRGLQRLDDKLKDDPKVQEAADKLKGLLGK